MKLARGLERRLERMVEGLAAKLFKGNLQPVEIATRLVREADLAVVETDAGPTIPNVFRVSVSAGDLEERGVELLSRELVAALSETAAERGWRTEGPLEVAILRDEAAAPGTAAVTAAFATGPMMPWAALVGTADGRSVPISHNRAIVGRSTTADVTVPGGEVSRHHALIWREGGASWVADLGSANGTSLNGTLLAGGSQLQDGDVLGFGPATYLFRSR